MAVDPEAVEELLALWRASDPDPVDLFEEKLAREIGLVRYPRMTEEEWRRVRVVAIDAAEEK